MPHLHQALLDRAVQTDPPWLDRRLFPFESRYLELDGNRVHYVDEGEGPVLLLLHPSPAWSFIYRDIIRVLRDRYRCVALDFPGFGLSSAAAGFGYSAREHARVVHQFVEARRLDDLTLLVHSQSGPIGLHVAGRTPERLAGLVIVNTFAWRLDACPSIKRMLGFVGSDLSGLINAAFNATLWYFQHSGIYRKLTPAEVAAYYAPFRARSARFSQQRTMASLLQGTFLSEVERSVQRIGGLPTLILFSDGDERRTRGGRGVPGWTERHARTFPNHELVILPHTRHFPQEDAPDAMATAIDAWHRRSVRRGPRRSLVRERTHPCTI
jgi:haloalkane dehalogenase